MCQFCEKAKTNDCAYCAVEDCLKAVTNAPTIVEASNGTDNLCI